MTNRPDINPLYDLFNAVTSDLLEKIRNGKASASDVANAIKILKDNGIQADPETNENLRNLAEELPTTFEDEEDPDLDTAGDDPENVVNLQG